MKTWEEINAAIKLLLEKATEGKTGDDKDAAFGEESKNLLHSIRQFWNDSGRSAQRKTTSTQQAVLEDEISTLKETAESQKTEIEKLGTSDGTEDQKLIDAKKEIVELKTESVKLTEQNKLDKEEAQKVSEKSMVSIFSSDLKLLGKGIFTDDHLELELIRMERDGRIHVTEDDGGNLMIAVLQKGKTSIDILADDRKGLLNLVIEEMREHAPKDRLITGAKGGGGHDHKGGDHQADEWQAARNKAAAVVDGALKPEDQETRLAGMK